MTWKIFFLISSKSCLVAIDPKVVFSLLSFWSEKGGLYFFCFLGECFPGKSFLAWQILLLLLLSNALTMSPALSCSMFYVGKSAAGDIRTSLLLLFSVCFLESTFIFELWWFVRLRVGWVVTRETSDFLLPSAGVSNGWVCLVRLLTILNPQCELFLGLKLHLARVFRGRILDRWLGLNKIIMVV